MNSKAGRFTKITAAALAALACTSAPRRYHTCLMVDSSAAREPTACTAHMPSVMLPPQDRSLQGRGGTPRLQGLRLGWRQQRGGHGEDSWREVQGMWRGWAVAGADGS